MRSNCRIARSRFKNVTNSLLTADSGVTNTTAAASGCCRLSHAAHDIPNPKHRRIMSPRNAINGTTTTVVPPCSAHAGNMNNKLLPAPVGITDTTGLLPATMAWMASLCTPRNSAVLPIICCSWASTSIFLSRAHRLALAWSASHSNGARLRFLELSSSPSIWKPKNRCQSVLDMRNCNLLSATAPAISMMPRAYIMPATCDVCPACKSAIIPAMFSSSHALFSSPSSGWNALPLRMNRRLMPMAISRYAGMVNSNPNPIRLSRFNVSRNRSLVHLRPFGSAGHMCDDMLSFSHTIASNRCWNGNTNHM